VRRVLAVVLLLGGVLAAQESPKVNEDGRVEDISGIGFALRSDSASSDIESMTFMLKVSAEKPEEDSKWLVDVAAIRMNFSTYFLEVLVLDSESLKANVQPITVNEFNQVVLGDRVGKLELDLSRIAGLEGGHGILELDGITYKVIFYNIEVTENFARWVDILQ
jgi:hypothetical protein